MARLACRNSCTAGHRDVMHRDSSGGGQRLGVQFRANKLPPGPHPRSCRVVQYDPLTHGWFVQGQLPPYTCRVSINNNSHGRGGWRHDEIRCGLGAGAAPPPRQVGRIHACSTGTCSTMSEGVVAARL